MSAVLLALWGLFGGFAVEGLDLYAAVRRHGRWPWQRGRSREAGPRAYLVAELVRLAIGAGLAAAAGTSGQITTPFAALAVGVAAPLVVERLSHAIPLEVSAVPAPADRASLEPDVVSAGPAGSGPRMGD